MFRVAFDPSLPVKVTCNGGLPIGGLVIEDGSALEWRELGVSEQMLLDWWRAGVVSFVAAPAEVAAETEPQIEPETPPRTQGRRRRS